MNHDEIPRDIKRELFDRVQKSHEEVPDDKLLAHTLTTVSFCLTQVAFENTRMVEQMRGLMFDMKLELDNLRSENTALRSRS